MFCSLLCGGKKVFHRILDKQIIQMNDLKLKVPSKYVAEDFYYFSGDLGPVVQSLVSLTSSLRIILLTVLVDSIYNILIFFAEKM